jgi:choline dehydrogenase-like flavoprotein
MPLDPVDFRFWPVTYDDLLPWYEKAAAFLGCGPRSISPAPGAFSRLNRFDATRDECCGPELRMSRRWHARIRSGDGPTIVLGARVLGLAYEAGAISHMRVRIGAREQAVRARHFVLTAGGLGTLRLLLLAQREQPFLFGGPDGPLGRGYMGHLTGAIADLVPAQAADAHGFAPRALGSGIVARRRIQPLADTVVENDLVNIAFWLDNGDAGDAGHGDAATSAKYLATRLAPLLRDLT